MGGTVSFVNFLEMGGEKYNWESPEVGQLMGGRLHLDGSLVAICVVLQRHLRSTFFIAAQQSEFGGGAPEFTFGKHFCKSDNDAGHV